MVMVKNINNPHSGVHSISITIAPSGKKLTFFYGLYIRTVTLACNMVHHFPEAIASKITVGIPSE